MSNLAAAIGVNSIASRAGISGDARPSDVLGLIIYGLILLPVLVAALNALQLEAVAAPTSNMLDKILTAIPNIFAAVVIVVLAYVIGKIVAEIISGVLAGVGFNSLPGRLGLSADMTVAGQRPAGAAGLLVLSAILLFATIEAVNLLGFVIVAELVAEFVTFGGGILLGLLIIGVGLFLANVAAASIRGSGTTQAPLLSVVARVAVIAFAAAIGLRQMGIANEIIILAFGLPLATMAIAAAIAIGVSVGVGGREVAAQELARARDGLRGGPSGTSLNP